MKIALINENSQAAKNGIIEAALKKSGGAHGPRGSQLRHVRSR